MEVSILEADISSAQKRRGNSRRVTTVRYLERFQQTLVNPTWAQTVEREPLIAFSHYLSGRVNVLCSFADELLRASTVDSPVCVSMAVS